MSRPKQIQWQRVDQENSASVDNCLQNVANLALAPPFNRLHIQSAYVHEPFLLVSQVLLLLFHDPFEINRSIASTSTSCIYAFDYIERVYAKLDVRTASSILSRAAFARAPSLFLSFSLFLRLRSRSAVPMLCIFESACIISTVLTYCFSFALPIYLPTSGLVVVIIIIVIILVMEIFFLPVVRLRTLHVFILRSRIERNQIT